LITFWVTFYLRQFDDEILIDQRKFYGYGYGDVEKLYQQMKEKYRGNEPEISNWHYGQKEMVRKKSKLRRRNPISFSNLYWAFSGYGERPVRAGLTLIYFLIAVTLLMNFLGVVPAYGLPIDGVSMIQGFSGKFDF